MIGEYIARVSLCESVPVRESPEKPKPRSSRCIPPSAEVADRRELSELLESSENEAIRESIGPVGTRVHAVSGARALLPLFEVRTSRQRFAIRKRRRGAQLGEIALDETVISRPHGEPQTSMQRVEVEALTEVTRAAAIAGEDSSKRLCTRGGIRHEVLARAQVSRIGAAGAGIRPNGGRCFHDDRRGCSGELASLLDCVASARARRPIGRRS